MTIENQLQEDMKAAMRAKQQDLVMCIRQLKSKVQEAVNAAGFSGPVDDALHQKVAAAYIKQLERGISELGPAGDKGAALRAKYEAEITYIKRFLPAVLDEAATEQLVRAAMAATGATSKAQAGRVVGAVMKEHKGTVDAALAKAVAERLLA